MLKKISLFLLIVSIHSYVHAQSAEVGQVFNKYSSAEDGVNLQSGAAALSRMLVSLSAGNASATVQLKYSSNVSEVVENKNDIAPSSWVGLGWTLGHAKIICEDAGTMWLGDDSYYLITATNVKYKVLKDDNGKWWVESLPYWTIKPDIITHTFGSNTYEIIVGWKLTDDMGNSYYYGDGDYDESTPIRNATEYTLANPYSYGIVGVVDNGKDALFPNAWNLSEIRDIEGRFIKYKYQQFVEYIARKKDLKTVNSNNAYTKETYLKVILTSLGERAVFEVKRKDYKNEFLDVTGIPEDVDNVTSGIDAFIDPIERHYLSRITVQKKQKNDEIDVDEDDVKNPNYSTIKYIDFCYKQLNVKFNKVAKNIKKMLNKNGSKYVKRLLTSVVEYADEGEIQKELYTYYENDIDEDTGEPLNLGAIRTVKSNDCGLVEYIYADQAVATLDEKSGLHKDELPVVHVSMGTLEDGTSYILGINKKDRKVQVYFRISGKWVLQQNLENDSFGNKTDLASYTDDGYFIVGDKNWFVYVEKTSESSVYKPYKWNGRFWENHGKIEDNGSRDVVSVGPGYIVSARLGAGHKAHYQGGHIQISTKGAYIQIKMPWTVWGGFSDKIITENELDDDDDDRKYVHISTSKNHFFVFYKDRVAYNSGRLHIFSFSSDKSSLKEKIFKGLDDDNHFDFISDNIIAGAYEDQGMSGQYAVAVHFTESDNHSSGEWRFKFIQSLNGWQGLTHIMAMGDRYFAVRHNDYDDMSLLEYDGDKWNIVYDNENMVHHMDFDPRDEAEWDAISGNDFFVARRPWKKSKWGGHVVRTQREFELIKKVDGKWHRGTTSREGHDGRKHIYAGRNWFFVKELNRFSLNDGATWKDETVNESVFSYVDPDKISSMNDDFLTVEQNVSTIIYYKKKDSFISNIKSFFVDKKIVNDPIIDKTITYSYAYNVGMTSTYPEYDYVTKSPRIKGYKIYLPENAGYIEKVLCDYTGEKIGVAVGEICSERYFHSGAIQPIEEISKNYERYHGPEDKPWPGYIYIDRLINAKSRNNAISQTETYSYGDLNDVVESIVVRDDNTGKNVNELVNYFAANVDLYKNKLTASNRVAEKIATYQCVPDCGSKTSKLVSGSVYKYDSNMRISEEWNYAPQGNSRAGKFTFDWNSDKNTSWERVRTLTSYHNGISTEGVDAIGQKSAVVLDKGASGRVHAKVSNAGLDEILILPGDTCGIIGVDEKTCKIMDLDDVAFEKGDKVNGVDVGRFSKSVVYVAGEDALIGSVEVPKNTKYRFSAWVQGTDFGEIANELVVKINDKEKTRIPLKGRGLWEYVEWEYEDLPVGNQSYTLSLSSLKGSQIRMQDVRFVPYEASVSVAFWNKLLNKPVVTLDDRSFGSYVSYDFQGRVLKTYGETSSREIYMTSKNTFTPGVCGIPGSNVALKSLQINDISVPISENPGSVTITVPNNTDELNVSWETIVEGEKVFYRLYKEGSQKDFISDDCCSSVKQLSQSFDGTSMILDMAVSSVENPYSVKINKSTTGWIDYGNLLSEGFNPVYLSKNNVSAILYVSNYDIYRAVFENNQWTVNADGKLNDITTIGSATNGSFGYFFALPNYSELDFEDQFLNANRNALGYMSSIGELNLNSKNVLHNMNTFEGKGVESRLYRIASNLSGSSLYVAYEKTVSTEEAEMPEDDNEGEFKKNTESKKYIKKETSLVSKCLNNYSWYDCGEIQGSSVEDVDIAIGPSDIPYVVFVGKNQSRKKTGYVFIDSEEEYEDDESLNAPDDVERYSYEFEENNIIVKHLDKSGKKWIGYTSVEGDILELPGYDFTNAKRIKVASDEKKIYIAVLLGNESNSLFELKIFEFNPSNMSSMFRELIDDETKSGTIAYLNENNHFDLEVYDEKPFVAFENDDNENFVSVITYAGSRWTAVGKPGFAVISDKKQSLDLAFSGSNPYIVFREHEDSPNENRQGKIVAMKYSAYGDKNLTISSIGHNPIYSLFAEFRPYILNYQSEVPKSVDELSFNISLMNPAHVCAVSIVNNDKEEFLWESKENVLGTTLFDRTKVSNLENAKISLDKGGNLVELQVWGCNGENLTYYFDIRKDYDRISKANVAIQSGSLSARVLGTLDGNNITNSTTQLIYSSSSDANIIPKENETFEVTWPDDGTTSKTICIEHGSSWKMIVSGIIYSKNSCFEYDFIEEKIIVPSSSSGIYGENESSSSGISNNIGSSSGSVGKSQFVLIDEDGNESIVDIVVVRSSSSKNESETSDIVNSSNSSSSCTGVGCNANSSNSSSSCTGIGCNANPLNSSSSCSGYGCSSYTESSSSFIAEHREPYGDVIKGTAVPVEFSLLLDYKFVGGEKIEFANNVTVEAGRYAAKVINVAANAKIYGSLASAENVFVGSNAFLNNLVVGGQSSVQQEARIVNMIEDYVAIPVIPQMNISYGSENVNVTSEKAVVLEPGFYATINVFANAKVTFKAGVYKIKSLYVAPDASVLMNTNDDLIQFFIQENVNIGDRAALKSSGGAAKVFIYGNGQGATYIGVGADVDANIAYPNGNVELAPNSNLSGSAWAKTVAVGANAVIK